MPFSPRPLARLVILALLASPLALAADPAATPAAKPAAKPATKAAAKSPAKPAAATPSHSIGVQMGESLHRAGVSDELDYDAFLAGLKEGLAGKASTDEDRSAAQQFIGDIRNHLLEHNHAAAKAFLAKNGSAAGVVTTASGLQYRIVAAGDENGAAPGPNDKVTVNYRGKLLDGTEFDSSYARGTPATFPVSGVIKGWTEALQLMKPGAKWQLFVPPELAYDANSRPPIPPGSLLVFDVELLSVAPPAPAAPANKD
jgi:FKBP-type peptidyl-prolyl cis-trans isomerase